MAVAKQPDEQESMLAFVPAGIGRSIAEYFVALIPGAVLLLAFFLAAEGAVIVFAGQDIMAIAFLPVACIVPILSGVVSTLALEKIRRKPLTIQRGAMVGAAAALIGAFLSAILLVLVSVFTSYKAPFGSLVGSGLMVYAVLLVIIFMDMVLGALGGALVVKFIKEP